jgi:uncharacterized delta-60 repeat protein
VISNFPESTSGLALGLDSTGSAVVIGVAGDYVRNATAARFGPDGLVDSTFAGDGTALIDISGRDDFTDAVAIQPDDRPLLAGGAAGLRDSGDFAALQLTTDGLVDPSFSDDGKVTVDFGDDDDDADAALLEPDGKILLVGTIGDGKAGVARLLVAPGAADADADGVEDVKDSCPDQFGTRGNGCPKRHREHQHD